MLHILRLRNTCHYVTRFFLFSLVIQTRESLRGIGQGDIRFGEHLTVRLGTERIYLLSCHSTVGGILRVDYSD